MVARGIPKAHRELIRKHTDRFANSIDFHDFREKVITHFKQSVVDIDPNVIKAKAKALDAWTALSNKARHELGNKHHAVLLNITRMRKDDLLDRGPIDHLQRICANEDVFGRVRDEWDEHDAVHDELKKVAENAKFDALDTCLSNDKEFERILKDAWMESESDIDTSKLNNTEKVLLAIRSTPEFDSVKVNDLAIRRCVSISPREIRGVLSRSNIFFERIGFRNFKVSRRGADKQMTLIQTAKITRRAKHLSALNKGGPGRPSADIENLDQRLSSWERKFRNKEESVEQVASKPVTIAEQADDWAAFEKEQAKRRKEKPEEKPTVKLKDTSVKSDAVPYPEPKEKPVEEEEDITSLLDSVDEAAMKSASNTAYNMLIGGLKESSAVKEAVRELKDKTDLSEEDTKKVAKHLVKKEKESM